jgi:hypothetical protein
MVATRRWMQPFPPSLRKFRISNIRPPIQLTMNPLRFLVGTFVNTFGITQPTPENERKAGLFIAIMLGGVLLLIGLVAFALHSVLTQ